MSVVTLGVADLPRARAFYEAIGWTTGAEPGADVAFFQAGASSARYGTAPTSPRTAECPTAAAGAGSPSPTTWPRREMSTPRWPRPRRRSTIARGGGETFWGGYSGVFLDPDGHPWEIAHNPHWTLREDGSVGLGD